MTVAPVQDLIVDVMGAADPAAQRVAANRLERLGSTVGQDFAATVNERIDAGRSRRIEASEEGEGVLRSDGLKGVVAHTPIVRGPGGDGAVYRKFEAFVLQMFVESMLPKEASEVFGKGTAGTIWRSMLAEQIGNEMAKGNGIGIAKQLAKSREITDAAGVKG